MVHLETRNIGLVYTNLESGIIIEGYIFEIKNQTQMVREIFYELRNISFIDTVS